MTIDIRAKVYCSLGPVIQGSFSDSYIQGSGLITTRGSVELAGLFSPSVGVRVSFSYAKNGYMARVQRTLRVLSSFADPLKNITKVQLGCYLTYMSDNRPIPANETLPEPPITDDNPDEYNPLLNSKLQGIGEFNSDYQQCIAAQNQNQGEEYVPFDPEDQKKIPVPIQASAVFAFCINQLGLKVNINPLSSKFFIDKFDLSSGYINVISDLLVSESYYGHLNEKEKLIIRPIDNNDKGPLLRKGDIIDMQPIGSGELPADTVVVQYQSLVLPPALPSTTPPPTNPDPLQPEEEKSPEEQKRDWELEEFSGGEEEIYFNYTDIEGSKQQDVVAYVPYSKTVTLYGQAPEIPANQCDIYLKPPAVDLSDSVTSRVTRKSSVVAAVAQSYVTECLIKQVANYTEGDTPVDTIEKEFYDYDSEGNVIRALYQTFASQAELFGKVQLPWTYYNESSDEYHSVVLGTNPSICISEKQVFNATVDYVIDPRELPLKASQQVIHYYENYALTQQGQQAIARITEDNVFESAFDLSNYIESVSRQLKYVKTEVRTNVNRDIAQRRPGKASRVANEYGTQKAPDKPASTQATNGEPPVSLAKFAIASGFTSGKRVKVFSPPHNDDDYYIRSGNGYAVVRSNGQAKALRYGRIQNRLQLGNRVGASFQLPVELLPQYPFQTFYVKLAGQTAAYRTNGTSWAFDSNGIVASTDAIFWGGVALGE